MRPASVQELTMYVTSVSLAPAFFSISKYSRRPSRSARGSLNSHSSSTGVTCPSTSRVLAISQARRRAYAFAAAAWRAASSLCWSSFRVPVTRWEAFALTRVEKERGTEGGENCSLWSSDTHFGGMTGRGGCSSTMKLDPHFGGIIGRGAMGRGARPIRGEPERRASSVKEPSPRIRPFFGYISCGEKESRRGLVASLSHARCCFAVFMTGLGHSPSKASSRTLGLGLRILLTSTMAMRSLHPGQPVRACT
mmetsp:Transcript_8557/g.25221  ORF Transcript_8557/g.25221 Transcript_8557/m.25221 type:complete len:251 (-) Transcript_8557:2-754(-)